MDTRLRPADEEQPLPEAAGSFPAVPDERAAHADACARPPKLLLRQGEAAQLIGVSTREFRRWCHRGFAPAPIAGHGGRPLWSRDALVDWVRELAQQARRRGGVR